MSIVTYTELRVGLESLDATRTRNEQALHLLTREIQVLPFDEAAAERYGVMRAAVPGNRRDTFDRLIAAHAASLGLTLVTNNEADFCDYPGLVMENWVAHDNAKRDTARPRFAGGIPCAGGNDGGLAGVVPAAL